MNLWSRAVDSVLCLSASLPRDVQSLTIVMMLSWLMHWIHVNVRLRDDSNWKILTIMTGSLWRLLLLTVYLPFVFLHLLVDLCIVVIFM